MSYYRVQARVDLNAVCENIKNIKKILPVETKFMIVVKADAYGHGAVEISKAVEEDVDVFGVAIVEEGIELRQAGITKPILVLGFISAEQVKEAIDNDITLTVFKFETALAISKWAKNKKKLAKIHLKIDTGMNRIGYSPTRETVEEIQRISKLENIEIEGIFSHFTSSDELNKDKSKRQLVDFKNLINELENLGVNIPIRHLSNSAATLDIPEATYNMVRCGIMSYGIYPSAYVNKDKIKLVPAMSIKTHIIYLKEIKKGLGISYGSTFVSEDKMIIGTIPVGYADGYSWSLSNKSRVIINGQYAPVVGRICMDQFMVDVTDIEGVKEGDEVILLGNDKGLNISADELADLSNSFSYEFVCHIGKRIPRVY